ncbi:hypothetical protein [Amycolatopsis japonica]
MNEQTAAGLRRPFPKDQIGHLPKVVCKACSDRKCTEHKPKTCSTCKAYLGKHIHIDYVGHAHVTERLLNVDPGWSWEPLALSGQGLPQIDDNGGLWIRLTIGGKTMIGYGDAPGKGRGAVKELIGDAIRNAAMRFGVALDLWKKEPAEPVAETPPARRGKAEPVLTDEQKSGQLRAAIAAIGFKDEKDVEDIASEFFEWSDKKHEINKAPVAELERYLAHIQQDRS